MLSNLEFQHMSITRHRQREHLNGVGGWEGYWWAAAGGPRIMVTELHAGWPLEAQTIVQVMIELYPSKA